MSLYSERIDDGVDVVDELGEGVLCSCVGENKYCRSFE